MNKLICLVPICKVLKIDDGFGDVSACLTPQHCKLNTTLQYVCKPGFAASFATTTCLADHNWSVKPSCEKGMSAFPNNYTRN